MNQVLACLRVRKGAADLGKAPGLGKALVRVAAHQAAAQATPEQVVQPARGRQLEPQQRVRQPAV